MLLTNGRVYTLDAADTVVDTLVVRDGRIAFAGRRQDVNPPAGEPVVDLRSRAVLPGLVDAHAHLLYLARARFTLNAAHARSEEEVAARVAAEAARLAPGEWIAGRGWDQTLWPGGRFPTKASLDRAAPGSPVALVRVDGHATWASSAALRLAGIDRHTGDPAGGRVHGIHAAVTRRPREGPDPGWQPEQRMTRAEAVRAFTAWNAWAARQEADLGSLEPGKRADLVVLSDDVFACPESRIGDIVPLLTLVGGDIVFRREET